MSSAPVGEALVRPIETIRGADRVGDVRSRWFMPVLLGSGVVVFGALAYLTSYENFYYDEWDFVTGYRPGGSMSLLAPHNEHWSTIPILIWKLLFAVFGIRTHVPYETAALASHAACVVLLFVLVRRRSGDLPAFAAALLLLVLGAGAVDIVWAFQLAWTLSIGFGLLAMLVIEGDAWSTRRRIAAVAILLICSLLSSSIGLGFLLAVAVELAVDRTKRSLLPAALVPLAIYAAWFAVFARQGLAATDARAISPAYGTDVLSFLWWALVAAAAGLAGVAAYAVPTLLLRVLLAGVAALLAWHWYFRGRVEPWEAGLGAGLVGQYLVIAVARARYGAMGGADSHYVYVGVVFLLPLVGHAMKDFSWRWIWRPVVVAAIAICVLNNALLLAQTAVAQRAWMTRENAELRVVELMRGAPDLAMDQPLDPQFMPQLTAATYYAAIDTLGSPVPSSTPASLDALDPNAVDSELVTLFGGALAVESGGAASNSAPCFVSHGTAGSTLTVRVAAGGRILIKPMQSADAAIGLGYRLRPSSPLLVVPFDSAAGETVRAPDTGRPLTWLVAITGLAGDVTICGAPSP